MLSRPSILAQSLELTRRSLSVAESRLVIANRVGGVRVTHISCVMRRGDRVPWQHMMGVDAALNQADIIGHLVAEEMSLGEMTTT